MAGLLLWLLSAAGLGWAARRVSSRGFEHADDRLAAWPVLLFAAVVALAEGLAAAGWLASRAAWLGGTAVCAFVAATLRCAPPVQASSLDLKTSIRKPALAALGIAYAGLLLVALFVPPNNWDSMTYHLSRVGYYRQQGSFDFFPTNNTRQTELPLNAEAALLWTVTFLRSDRLAALLQYTAALCTALTTALICLRLRLRRGLALLALILCLGLPQIALQATTTQNDLVAAWLCAAAVYFTLRAAESGTLAAAVLAGVSIGLGIGTKPTAWLIVPSLPLVYLAAARHFQTASWRRAFLYAGCLALGCTVFFLPQALRNYRHNGSVLSDQQEVRVLRPSWHTFAANAVRTGCDLLDANDLPYPANRALGLAKRTLAQRLIPNLDTLNPPEATFPGTRFDFANNILEEDVAWFGLNGCALAVGGLAGLITALRRRNWLWLSFAALPLGFAIIVCLLLRWQPWGGRLFCPAMVLLLPLALYGLNGVLSACRRRIRRMAWKAMSWLAVCGAFVVLTQNELKPLLPRRNLPAVWQLTPSAQRCRARPYNAAVQEWAAGLAPSCVGVCGDHDQWDYLAFGPDFRHRVNRYGADINWRRAFTTDGCNFVLVQRSFLPALSEQLRAADFGVAKITALNDYWVVVAAPLGTVKK